jgi:glycosyltransferase 2 family protein
MVKRVLPWVVKGGVSMGLTWWVLSKVDLATAWAQAKTVDPWMLVACTALMAVQISLGAMRWGMVLRALSGSFTRMQIFSLYYIGVFFSIVLPGAVGGDAMRMWYSRRAGLGLATSINSVMLERVITVQGLVLLVAAMQPLLLARVPDLPGVWVFPALSVAGVAGILLLAVLDSLPESLYRWRLVRGLALLAADTRRVCFRLRSGGPLLAVAIFGHINLSLAVYVLARGLDLDIDVLDCIVLVPPVILIMTLPISIAGWGVRETAMVAAFGFVGVSHQSALVLSVLFGIMTMVTALPGGLVFLWSGERNVAEAVVVESGEV